MKNFLSLSKFLLLFALIVLSSCKEDIEEPSSSDEEEIELESPAINLGTFLGQWTLASTPNTGAFEHADAINDWRYNDDRAQMSLYRFESQVFSEYNGPERHYFRPIFLEEIYPDSITPSPFVLSTMDLAFFPNERGPYNFNIDELNFVGKLDNPKNKWGGIQKGLTFQDFEKYDIDTISFWMMDPFIENSSNNGTLYFNLGTISEDILKDGRLSFENGLPYGTETENTDTTEWARIPNNENDSDYFDGNDAANEQDLGLDGLNDEGERILFEAYLDAIADLVSSDVEEEINADPANDNFRNYINSNFDAETDLITRYKRYKSPQGNNLNLESNNVNPLADSEDLNDDKVLEQAEAFFQYQIDLHSMMDVGDGYITETRVEEEIVIEGRVARWFKFKIPIAAFDDSFGGIQDFTSIQSIRMYLTDFEEPIILRLVEFELLRSL